MRRPRSTRPGHPRVLTASHEPTSENHAREPVDCGERPVCRPGWPTARAPEQYSEGQESGTEAGDERSGGGLRKLERGVVAERPCREKRCAEGEFEGRIGTEKLLRLGLRSPPVER